MTLPRILLAILTLLMGFVPHEDLELALHRPLRSRPRPRLGPSALVWPSARIRAAPARSARADAPSITDVPALVRIWPLRAALLEREHADAILLDEPANRPRPRRRAPSSCQSQLDDDAHVAPRCDPARIGRPPRVRGRARRPPRRRARPSTPSPLPAPTEVPPWLVCDAPPPVAVTP